VFNAGTGHPLAPWTGARPLVGDRRGARDPAEDRGSQYLHAGRVGSAAFMLVSIFGFSDAVGQAHVSLDPSRVAAQIVSGIGFIGGGIIFVRRDSVRGLTTAAGVWVTAAVGMACGGNLPLVALATTVSTLWWRTLTHSSFHCSPARGTRPRSCAWCTSTAKESSVRSSPSARGADSRSPMSRSSMKATRFGTEPTDTATGT
jgi:hypothetical protein